MPNRLRRWEAALMIAVAVAVPAGMWLNAEQAALADSVIRLHVIANSDSEADQALKLQVRDRILGQAADLYPAGADVETARQGIEEHLTQLAQAGQRVVEEQGYDYPVTAAVKEVWFPTKRYEDFSLPAGKYTALQVVIGEGSGQNWWCVVFPPLCLGSVTEELEAAEQAGSFTPGQTALITGESGGYVVKFKAMELWEHLKRKFT
ncbi:MAG: stage II sporulation protein R [Oscillospiraceae bacterium]|nr:stage II sporulation protein R [Oscillospiraceae bacterium]